MKLVNDTISKPIQRLYLASWIIVAYTVVIIAWGAWVRISGSGDGCGEHWPLCHGEAVPLGGSTKTWIEVSHRYSTALFGVFVLAQLLMIQRLIPKTNRARSWIWWVLAFTLSEALIGRALVKSGLVNESESLKRLIMMPLHLINTSLLLFSQVMTAENISFGGRNKAALNPHLRRLGAWLVVGIIVLLISGAIAALGSHLLPSQSLLSGLVNDISTDSHLAVRLRILHPILGLALPIGAFLIISNAIQVEFHKILTPVQIRLGRHLGIATLLMVFLGVTTLLTLAPTWLKLAHLTVANILIISMARLFFHTMYPSLPPSNAEIGQSRCGDSD